jgi:lipoate-protein ligase A
VTVGPRPLFDVDPLRHRDRATIGVLRQAGPVVVLGSRQDVGVLDASALRRDEVEVRRRRGGGGAVLLVPEDCWVELWLPGAGGVTEDVRATACLAGEWWRAAFAAHGVTATVHRGGMVHHDEGAVACFAGLGPGELTILGRKVLGLSQWRCREGVLVSAVVAARPPEALRAYLAASAPRTPSLPDATSLREAAPQSSADALAASLRDEVSAAIPSLTSDNDVFT